MNINFNKKQGFTLIELLVVIAIISLISSVIFASLRSAREKARDSRRLTDMKQIQTALEIYYGDNNTYPVMQAYFVPPSQDSNWSTALATALRPYLSVIPKEYALASHGYLYRSLNSGQKYGLATGFESSSYASLLTSDGGGETGYYELGPAPPDCARAGLGSWWDNTNCPP